MADPCRHAVVYHDGTCVACFKRGKVEWKVRSDSYANRAHRSEDMLAIAVAALRDIVLVEHDTDGRRAEKALSDIAKADKGPA